MASNQPGRSRTPARTILPLAAVAIAGAFVVRGAVRWWGHVGTTESVATAPPADKAPAAKRAPDLLQLPDVPPPAGRWKTHRPAPTVELTPEDGERMERLLALGYVSGSKPAPDREGVVRNDPQKVYAGLNFVVSGYAPEAFLTDMEGKVLHTWRRSYEEVWPERPPGGFDAQYWRRARLLPDGSVLAIFEATGS